MEYLAQAGTFDAANYGDLLFPLLSKRRLPGWEIRAVSPVGGGPVWSDCVSSVTLEDLLGTRCGGMIIGGGNIVHPNRSPLTTYLGRGAEIRGYADLWIGASLAADESIPLLWNAPGVPKPIQTEFIGIVREALGRANYLSVRDEQSRRFLLDISPDVDIAVVPDPAWDLPSLWTPEELDRQAANVFGGSTEAVGPHVAIHLNDRYVGDLEMAELARIIDDFCAVIDARPVLIAIGPCHHDDALAKKMAPLLASKPIVIDRPASLAQICAVISRAAFYCGSSMHGYITAAAFGVPAIVVAKTMFKFEGTVSRAGAPETLIASWTKVPELLREIDRCALSDTFVAHQKLAVEELDAHWSMIISHLDPATDGTWEPGALYRYRADFLDAACRREIRQATEYKEIAKRARERSKRASYPARWLARMKKFGKVAKK